MSASDQTSTIERYHNSYAFISPLRFQNSLCDRTVLITGASRGIGRAIANAFAQAGANVACVARGSDELTNVASSLANMYGIKSRAFPFDLASSTAIPDLVKCVEEQLGPIDILINNAGVDRIGSFEDEVDLKTWRRVLEINFHTPVALTHSVLPGMLDRGHGVIISIGSRACGSGGPYMTAYASSKTALMQFHQCLDQETRTKGLLNFIVQPGTVRTSIMETEDAIVCETAMRNPELAEILCSHDFHAVDSAELAADTCVMLAVEKKAKLLSGLYINAERDLEAVLEEISKPNGGQITQRKLYCLKIEEL